jgi:2,5-dihydroxypyridine 5,6-dioxygenase
MSAITHSLRSHDSELAEFFLNQAKQVTSKATLVEIPLATQHGEEPPALPREAMLNSHLIIALCKFPLAHSRVRIATAKNGGRFLSMPLYSWEMLADPAITVDYKKQGPAVRFIADAFSHGDMMQVTSAAGTDIRLSIQGRQA